MAPDAFVWRDHRQQRPGQLRIDRRVIGHGAARFGAHPAEKPGGVILATRRRAVVEPKRHVVTRSRPAVELDASPLPRPAPASRRRNLLASTSRHSRQRAVAVAEPALTRDVVRRARRRSLRFRSDRHVTHQPQVEDVSRLARARAGYRGWRPATHRWRRSVRRAPRRARPTGMPERRRGRGQSVSSWVGEWIQIHDDEHDIGSSRRCASSRRGSTRCSSGGT